MNYPIEGNHPSETQLALFCENDLGLWERWRVRTHVRRCEHCRQELSSFRASAEDLKSMAAELPAGVNWPRLSEEMRGNVRVGLAAGECIEGFERRPHLARHSLGSHAALVLACATVIVVITLWLRLPRPEVDHLMASFRKIRVERIGHLIRTPALQDVVLEASSSEIEVKSNGSALSLLPPDRHGSAARSGIAVTVSMQGSAGARYVDEDTGQVTTNRVYYAQ